MTRHELELPATDRGNPRRWNELTDRARKAVGPPPASTEQSPGVGCR